MQRVQWDNIEGSSSPSVFISGADLDRKRSYRMSDVALKCATEETNEFLSEICPILFCFQGPSDHVLFTILTSKISDSVVSHSLSNYFGLTIFNQISEIDGGLFGNLEMKKWSMVQMTCFEPTDQEELRDSSHWLHLWTTMYIDDWFYRQTMIQRQLWLEWFACIPILERISTVPNGVGELDLRMEDFCTARSKRANWTNVRWAYFD